MSEPCLTCLGTGYLKGVADETARAEICPCNLHCAACDDTRFVVVEENGYEVARPCTCQPLLDRVSLFNRAGIPAGYGEKSVAGFVDAGGTQGSVKLKLALYLKNFHVAKSAGLLLIGPTGTGKTHLLCGILNYLTLERGIGCRFVDFFHLTARIKATFDQRSGESQEDILLPLVEAEVLAIDELGKGLGTPWELNIIDQLISRRYNSGRIVLATTNYRPEGWDSHKATPTDEEDNPTRRTRIVETLEDRIGLRMYSRLAENCEIHKVEGPDHRLTGMKNSG